MLTFFLNTDPVEAKLGQSKFNAGRRKEVTLSSLQEVDSRRVHRLVDRSSSRLRSSERLSVRIQLGNLPLSVGVETLDESTHSKLDEIERHEPDLRENVVSIDP